MYMHYCKIEIYADRGEVMYMHNCKFEMYADRGGGICTMQGWGWYKILGRSESLAVKKPSNRSPTHCTGS